MTKNRQFYRYFASVIFFTLILPSCSSKKVVITQPQPQKVTTQQSTVAPKIPTVPAVGKKISTPLISPPEITIGLAIDKLPHQISAFSGFYLIRKDKDLLLYESKPGEYLTITAKEAMSSSSPNLYSVQVGSYEKEKEAEQKAKELATLTGAETEVFQNKYDHFFRIRFTPLPQELANDLASKIAVFGFINIRVISLQKNDIGDAVFIRIFDETGEKVIDIAETLVVVSRDNNTFVKLDGKPYRGHIEFFINQENKLTFINRLNLEDYLKGVVPGEMSGSVYPMLEALKAQAVAARTYAIKNLGQFSKAGYDLCATPLCQVYGGVSVEQQMTNQAVEETTGIIATYQNLPINAMYTSTCGGSTEDVENVFPEMSEPYLKGVTCYPEQTDHGVILLSKNNGVKLGSDGIAVNSEIALLDIIGYLNENLPLSGNKVTSSGLYQWQQRYAQFMYSGNTNIPRVSRQYPTKLEILLQLLNQVGWQARINAFINSIDTVDLAQFSDYKSFPSSYLKEIAYLLRQEIIAPYSDNTLKLNNAISYYDLAKIYYRLFKNYRMIPSKRGIFFGYYQDGTMDVYIDGLNQKFSIDANPYLFYKMTEDIIFADRLLIRPGDKIEFALDTNEKVKYILLESHRKGLSDDRFSGYYYWFESFTKSELNAQINSRIKIGELISIEPVKYGKSGRIAILKITGTQGSAVLKGLEIRRVLGIKENLFIMEIRKNSKGEDAYYYFSGKGWGHGVGMCQVGAYGMALRGKKYDEILKHYYTGIELRRLITK
ncbi:MAG: SpoIID/LytB domain-containing protein [Acidobacteria bacterium]|nr:SpoIID/LytB domain-containing protein [Acidobacteriota bacterium]